jgi:V/A-type H+-transporting ATPase subunit K
MLSLIGAAAVATLSGLGTAWGVSIPGRAANGLLCEEPERFGSSLIYVALPGTSGNCGFISGVVVLIILGVFGWGVKDPTLEQGIAILGVCLFQSAVQWAASVYQRKVCAARIAIVAKHPDDAMKGVVNAVMVETYAVLGLLTTILVLMFAVAPTLQ